MNLIRILVEYRLDNFIKEYDIEIDDFYYPSRDFINNKKWVILKQKMISHNHKYINNVNDELFCYVTIKNIIWKNIINHEIRQTSVYKVIFNSFLYNYYHYESMTMFGISINRNLLLNKSSKIIDTKLEDNLNKLQTLVINHIMFIDFIVKKFLISDLLNITKMYMFEALIII